MRRASFLCEYCKASKNYSPSPFDIEHILPTSLGGNSDLDNLAYACNGCNCLKSNKIVAIDPLIDKDVPLFHPRQHEWPLHFAWDTSGLLIIGTTPTGRATVIFLKLNRLELVNLRSLLATVGKHPPE
ncbi:MAG: HNH endonuclease [Saprospiraceae bacterium]